MRLMQWQTIPSVVDTLNKKAIDEIRNEIEEIKQRLSALDERQRKLNDIIERGKELKAVKDTSVSQLITYSWCKLLSFV